MNKTQQSLSVMIDFAAIPVFVTLIETGSFSRAAEQLGSSKSAVSKRISLLETRLGVKLIHRTTRKLSLTQAGEQYLSFAKQAYLLANQGEDLITQAQGQPRGLVKFGAPMSFGNLHLAPLLAQFQRDYPEIEIDMQLDDRLVDMVDAGLDFVIRIGELKDSSLVAKYIAPCHSIICASPAYLALHGEPETPQALTKHNCLRYSYYQAGNDWLLSGAEGVERITPKGKLTINNSEALYQVLLNGAGIGQLPNFIAANAVAKQQLVPLLTQYPLPEHGIYALFPNRKHTPTKVSLLVDYLSNAIANKQQTWQVS